MYVCTMYVCKNSFTLARPLTVVHTSAESSVAKKQRVDTDLEAGKGVSSGRAEKGDPSIKKGTYMMLFLIKYHLLNSILYILYM
jgi:hypothetical protein